MTMHWKHRGAATVGHVQDYDAITAAAVIYLRMWCESKETQTNVMNDFVQTLGMKRERRAIEALGELCGLCIRHGRRPLCRHGVHCKCVGADEASFGHFIATAAEGEREDAMLFATLFVRPDVAPIISSLAADFGLALKQMNLAAPKEMAQMQTYQPTQPTLH